MSSTIRSGIFWPNYRNNSNLCLDPIRHHRNSSNANSLGTTTIDSGRDNEYSRAPNPGRLRQASHNHYSIPTIETLPMSMYAMIQK